MMSTDIGVGELRSALDELFSLATVELARYLGNELPKLSPEWWTKNVIDLLTFQQERMVNERRLATLQHLDFAALLRVVEKNWYELNSSAGLPREVRDYVRELQTLRNRWAHGESVSQDDFRRAGDTIRRVMKAVGAEKSLMGRIDSVGKPPKGTGTTALPMGSGGDVKPPKPLGTTDIGYVNRNRQQVIRKTEKPGNDHNQKVYVLRCLHCQHEYGANGSDIFQRRCPDCQGGATGLDYR